MSKNTGITISLLSGTVGVALAVTSGPWLAGTTFLCCFLTSLYSLPPF
jgi:4-hydroxybenzoate polyprenyltransferase